ncbi:hypothetical protein AB0269_09850 [Microbacterium sp. NPDC077644]|uniref:hypothetical protein n=1 Tax=Microbacterium sp. NPDC077644 TaxID=3155055 RepID=UPI00344F079D
MTFPSEGEVNVKTIASRRVRGGFAWGAFAVLGWAAFTLLSSTGTAHAEENPDGPLDGITSVVGSTVGAGAEIVGAVVDDVVLPAVDHVAPVVTETLPAAAAPVADAVSTTVQAVPVVRDVVSTAVAPVSDAVVEAAPTVTAPVTDLLQDSPVSRLTDPVVETARSVPVVGDLLDELSVPDAVAETSAALDATTASLGRTAQAVVPAAVGIVDRAVPSAPADPDPVAPPPVAPAPSVDPTGPAVTNPETAALPDAAPAARSSVLSASVGSPSLSASITAQLFLDAQRVEASVDALVANATGVPSAPLPAAHAPPAAPASAAPVGGGGGVVTDAADTFAASSTTRALPGGRGPTDDDLPSAPVFETDASPD